MPKTSVSMAVALTLLAAPVYAQPASDFDSSSAQTSSAQVPFAQDAPPLSETQRDLSRPVMAAAPTQVRVVQDSTGKWQLLRDNVPYFVKGAGGWSNLALMKHYGANSVRTWSADNLDGLLNQAQSLGLTVTVGLGMGQKQAGFNYNDPNAVANQFNRIKQQIERYKNHPAVLMWGIGNEMDGDGTDPAPFRAIEQSAAYIKQTDPNHPTMCVLEELGNGGIRVKNAVQYAPSLDIIGINAYAGSMPSVGARLAQIGLTKPFMITEFGAYGHWNMAKTSWKAPTEHSSTEKAGHYYSTYQSGIMAYPGWCLGSYAFLWGSKTQVTATWYGMFLPGNIEKLGSVDTMSRAWTGNLPAEIAPEIFHAFSSAAGSEVGAGTRQSVSLIMKTNVNPLTFSLRIQPEIFSSLPAPQISSSTLATLVPAAGSSPEMTFTTPSVPGPYRVYAYVKDGKGAAATVNFPFRVVTNPSLTALPKPSAFPFSLYSDAEKLQPYSRSGKMGKASAFTLTDSTTTPYAGTTCLKVVYTETREWAGLAWQNPYGNWGGTRGGYDLTGAKRLTLWARGQSGGEKVSFATGLNGPSQPFPDSTRVELGTVTLSQNWQKYTIDLNGRNLTALRTGFWFGVPGQGKPVTFSLDEIQFEGETSGGGDNGNTPPPSGLPQPLNYPFAVYAEGGETAYERSGYMGNYTALRVASTNSAPRSGATCLKVDYTTTQNWAGLAWQNPAGDWGDRKGGYDLSGAKRLTFWAKGAKGGERAKFAVGLLTAPKPYPDSARVELGYVTLSQDWQQYTIDLTGKNLSAIKSAFWFMVQGQGTPVTFYLDDIQFEN